jgi:hypothetical protein
MPPLSFHLLQPLEFGCYATLKRAYSREVKVLIRYHINHITELEFLLALEVAVRTQVRTHHAMQPKRIV